MANTKNTTSTPKVQSRNASDAFAVILTTSIDPKINNKLEERIAGVLKDISGLKTVNQYFKGLVDGRLLQDKENFNTIHALLSHVQENVDTPLTRLPKMNMSVIIQKEMTKQASSDEDSLIKTSSFYSDWQTPRSPLNVNLKAKQLERSNKQRRAKSFVRKTKLDLKTMLDTINIKKDQANLVKDLKETKSLALQKSSRELLMAHKRKKIVSHLKKIKRQKAKRLKILKDANKKYAEMKEKPTLYERMETAYSKKLEKSIKSVKIEKKKYSKPWDYEKLKEHESAVKKTHRERMEKIDEMKNTVSNNSMNIFRDTSKIELLKKQKEFAKLVQTKYKPTNFTENTIEAELLRVEYEKDIQKEELMNKIRDNQEKSKNYLQESLSFASRNPKKKSNDDKENQPAAKTLKNYLPEISKGLKKKAPETLDKMMSKQLNTASLPALMVDINKYESLNKSKLMDLGKNGISKKKMEMTEALYKDVIEAKLNILNKMKN